MIKVPSNIVLSKFPQSSNIWDENLLNDNDDSDDDDNDEDDESKLGRQLVATEVC